MRRKALACMWLVIACLVPLAAEQAVDMAALFPEMAGWRKDGSAETFVPENLYEHIDGAAEGFLAYGFRRLAVQNYVNQERQAVCAEIYFHGTPEDAFGIYGSEKPLAGNYLAIGSEGYREEGVLNFISDAFYVKLNAFDLGARGSPVLYALGEKIVQAIGGRNALPEILGAFPAGGKIAHSERYISSNFLGHEFLRSAFTADYDLQGRKFQLFIMRAADENTARATLQRYASLDRERSAPEIRPGDLTIRDPYNGPVRISWQGAFIWGTVGLEPAAGACLEEIARNLAGR